MDAAVDEGTEARGSGSGMDVAADKAEERGNNSGWELLYCGGTNFETMDQEGVSAPQGNLLFPTRLRPLLDVNIRLVATGCTACHCVALDAQGQCYTWGRNEKGQLGHGDNLLRNLPTIVSGVSRVEKASVGRHHTVVVTTDKKSFAFGDNKHGQLGMSSLANECELSPVACTVNLATDVFCGADFTVWLSEVAGSSILTAGHSQYGQLGRRTDNECNAKDSYGKLTYDPQPIPEAVKALEAKRILKIACGTNHTVAVDSTGVIYTWGRGEHGRLGHGEFKDELEPRPVEFFENIKIDPENVIVSAGSASSACTSGAKVCYMWGMLDADGAQIQIPKPIEFKNLRGWPIQYMASGNTHHVVAGKEFCLSWGAGLNEKLGYGTNREKSSGKPKSLDTLVGMRVTSVGCGYGFSLFTVDRAIGGHRIHQLKTYEGDTSKEEVQEINKDGMYKEDDNGDGSDSDYGENKAKGRRGRGVKRRTSELKQFKRGRGHPGETESSGSGGNREIRGNRGGRGTRGRRGSRK